MRIMKKKYKIQLIILYFVMANVLGFSFAVAYKFSPEKIYLIDLIISIVWGLLLMVIQRKIVNNNKMDIS